MHRKLSLLVLMAFVAGGCSYDDTPTVSNAADPTAAARPKPPSTDADATAIHAMRTDFPFPVMPEWVERNRLEVRDLPRQVLAATWIHEGDPAAHSAAYRHTLEAAGYRLEPGELSGNSEIAFTGTGEIAGQTYQFEIDFSRDVGGDRRVLLVFTPCSAPC